MKRSKLRLLELAWLIIAILSVIAGLHRTSNTGFVSGIMFFIMALISFAMYFFRRNLRRKVEVNKQEEE